MKKYRVCVEISGRVERYVEAENEEEAQDIVLENIDWDDVELYVNECYEVKEHQRKYVLAD